MSSAMARHAEKVGAMPDDKLREAAARLAGWQVIEDSRGRHHLMPGESIVQFIHRGEPVRELPDYVGSQDAIQKAVDDVIGSMNDSAMQSYVHGLLRATQGGEGGLDERGPFDWYDVSSCANATARERCVAFVTAMSGMAEGSHDYRNCTDKDCQECQDLVDHGLVTACDDCGLPGSTESDGWTLLNDGRMLCNACASKPGMVCDVPGCSFHPIEEGANPKGKPCAACLRTMRLR